MERSKLYLAGPMSGLPEYNYPAFFEAERFWKEAGYKVLNPAANDEDTSKERAYYLRMAFKQVTESDAIALLSGWHHSVGAVMEANIAAELGLQFFAQTTEHGGGWEEQEMDKIALAKRLAVVHGCKRDEPKPEAPSTESILQEAQRLIHGDRNADYGHPADNHGLTARLMNTYYGTNLFDAKAVCMFNVLQKLSRERNAAKRDNLTDACGYLGNIEMIQERERSEVQHVPV